MTRRYGRNQRRAHREQIAALDAQVQQLGRRAFAAETRETLVAERVLNKWLEDEHHIDLFRKDVAERLAYTVAPHLREAAGQVQIALEQGAQRQRGRGAVGLDLRVRQDGGQIILRGYIDSIEWNVVVSDGWRHG